MGGYGTYGLVQRFIYRERERERERGQPFAVDDLSIIIKMASHIVCVACIALYNAN